MNYYSSTLEKYGIHKNGTPFAVATSLMSKYAYFELLQAVAVADNGLHLVDRLEGGPLAWLVDGQHYAGLQLFKGYHST